MLVYISNRRGHEHAGCSILHKRNLPLLDGHTELPDILVDTVREPDTPGGFPGLYPLATSTSRLLRSELNSTTSLYLAINVTWGCRKTIVTVNLRNGSVIDQCTGEMDSYVLLGSDGYQRLLATRSSMIVPPELVLGVLQPGAQPRIVWSTIKAWPYEFIDGKHCKGPTASDYFALVLADRVPSLECEHTIFNHRSAAWLEARRSDDSDCVPS